MVGIIGAMENEISLLRKLMESPVINKIGEFEFIKGKLEGHNVILLRCGIGKVAAAVGCALLINNFKPDFVINTGSAGGIDSALHFGDVIISTGLLYHDVDVTAFRYAPGKLPGQPQIFLVDDILIARAERAVGDLKNENILPAGLNYCRGLIATGDTFMHKPESIAELHHKFPNVSAVEMEGAAIAHCCRLLSVPVLVIRALSDIAGIESPVKFDEFLPIASKHSAEIVRRIIQNLN